MNEATSPAPRDGLAGSDEAIEALVDAAAQREFEMFRAAQPEGMPSTVWDEVSERVRRSRRNQIRDTVTFVAARVRAEADEHYARADSADLTDAYREMDELSAQLSTVVAEAVAEERQRIAVGIRELPLVFEHDGALLSKSPEQVRSDAVALAAGSVSVATPDETVESMCHWTQGRGNAQAESHEDFHYGSPCPYESMAAVLRGEPDPRDAARAVPVPRIELPGVDPTTGRPWDVARLRHWEDRLEAFAEASAWLDVLADAVEAAALGTVDAEPTTYPDRDVDRKLKA